MQALETNIFHDRVHDADAIEWFDPGGFQKLLLLGSDVVGDEALIRFYLLHVMILPLALSEPFPNSDQV